MKATLDFDELNNDTTNFELQRRSVLLQPNGVVQVIYYVWLSEERKKQNHCNWGTKYEPFDARDKVSMTISGMKLSGKIMTIDTSYYDGDCHVLYIALDKRSSKKWIDVHEKKSE